MVLGGTEVGQGELMLLAGRSQSGGELPGEPTEVQARLGIILPAGNLGQSEVPHLVSSQAQRVNVVLQGTVGQDCSAAVRDKIPAEFRSIC